MKKKIMCIAVIAIALTASWNIKQSKSELNKMSNLTMANVEALAKTAPLESGTCYGTGPHFSDQSCPGGPSICCWAHTHVYGED